MIHSDCEPQTEDEVVIEILAGPDNHDRYSYNLYWRTSYIPGHPNPEPRMTRGQCFFGVIQMHYDKHKDKLRTVDRRLKKEA